jgi:hypothetical protein
VELASHEARLSARLGARLAAAAAATPTSAERAGLGLATLSEIAWLLGDALRARAQARVEALPASEQRSLLAGPPPPVGPDDARTITTAVEALLHDTTHTPEN